MIYLAVIYLVDVTTITQGALLQLQAIQNFEEVHSQRYMHSDVCNMFN